MGANDLFPAARAIRGSVCPHDCPSTCALEVEVLDGARIGRVHGAKANSYTAGVICEKVGRYAERIHHEGIWPSRDFEGGLGINTLVGDDPIPPFGGGAFHDTAVWLRRDGAPTR